MGWVGVDLDATLAHWNTGDDIRQIGAVIPRTKERVLELLAKGTQVRILTARVSPYGHKPQGVAHQRLLISKWLAANGLPELPVTHEKDYEMWYLLDDRAVQVEKNTGQLAVDKAHNDALEAACKAMEHYFGDEECYSISRSIRELRRQ